MEGGGKQRWCLASLEKPYPVCRHAQSKGTEKVIKQKQRRMEAPSHLAAEPRLPHTRTPSLVLLQIAPHWWNFNGSLRKNNEHATPRSCVHVCKRVFYTKHTPAKACNIHARVRGSAKSVCVCFFYNRAQHTPTHALSAILHGFTHTPHLSPPHTPPTPPPSPAHARAGAKQPDIQLQTSVMTDSRAGKTGPGK